MFGSIGIPELVLVFVVVLLLFGPDKLPHFARTLGKTIRDFRQVVDQAKSTIEKEIGTDELRGGMLDLKRDVDGSLLDLKRGVRDMVDRALDEPPATAALPGARPAVAAPEAADPTASPAAREAADPYASPAAPAAGAPPAPPPDEKAQ